MPLKVLYEDNHLLAIAKPAGIATQGAARGTTSVVTLGKEYLRRKYHKPGNVYLGVVSRLDSPVSGVLLLARTSKAAARLNEQFRRRTVEKLYWALVEGRFAQPTGELIDMIAKDEAAQRMAIIKQVSADGGKARPSNQPQEARLSYRRIGQFPHNSLLEIALETGRKHQIRVQLASRGHPILGDRKYGSKQSFADGIALHCRRIVIEHPVKKMRLEIVCPAPKSFGAFKR
jgi:23S rRNA pseudouridine1911/1915/1917 synthase